MKRIIFILLFPFAAFAQVKISDMTAATTTDGTELVPIVQGTNKKATLSLVRGWSNLGSASQLLRVNAGATGLEFFTPSFATYPGAGIPLSTGSAWGTSITNNSSDWNANTSWIAANGANAVTAFSWGNHAGLYLPLSYSDLLFKTVTASTYTILESDRRYQITFTNPCTITLPNGLSTGHWFSVWNTSGGTLTFLASTTLNTQGGANTIEEDYQGAYFQHIGSNVWEGVGLGSPSSGLTVGTSTITGGTNTRVLYNNSGVLGEYTVSGSGNVAMTTSPTFVTPNIGTPSAATLTNATGLPVSTGISGLGTGVSTALSNNVSGSGSIALTNSPTFTTPNIGIATGTASGNHSLASGGTLTGVNTVTSNVADQQVNTGTWTASGDNQYHYKFNPNVTLSSNLSHVGGITQVGGTINANVNNQILRGLVINPSYAYGSFTRANYSQLGLDIRDGGTANGGFKFFTDAFTNTTNAFQMVNRTAVTTLELGVDSGAGYLQVNSGKAFSINSGSVFRILQASSRNVELATVTLDGSRTLFGPAWSGTAVTSTANQQSSNASFAFQGRGWNGSSAVTTYLFDTFDASNSTNLLFTSDRRFWNGSALIDISRTTSTGMMFLGGITNPTATLHIAAGTSSRAPLKIPSGTLLTTPESGSIEADASAIYWTNNSGIRIDLTAGGGGGTYYAPTNLVANATDANFTATVNGVHNILDGVASANRVITIPTGADGDVMKFYNTEDTRVWSFTGATVYLADRVTVVTELLFNVPCFMEKIDGRWIITN